MKAVNEIRTPSSLVHLFRLKPCLINSWVAKVCSCSLSTWLITQLLWSQAWKAPYCGTQRKAYPWVSGLSGASAPRPTLTGGLCKVALGARTDPAHTSRRQKGRKVNLKGQAQAKCGGGAHLNRSTWEAEAGGLLQVQGQPRLHGEILSQKQARLDSAALRDAVRGTVHGALPGGAQPSRRNAHLESLCSGRALLSSGAGAFVPPSSAPCPAAGPTPAPGPGGWKRRRGRTWPRATRREQREGCREGWVARPEHRAHPLGVSGGHRVVQCLPEALGPRGPGEAHVLSSRPLPHLCRALTQCASRGDVLPPPRAGAST